VRLLDEHPLYSLGVAMNQSLLRAALLVVMLSVFGCASTSQTADPSLGQQTLSLNDSESAELLVLNISGPTLISSNQNITDNGLAFISLPRQTYRSIRIQPGNHEYRFDDTPRGKRFASLQAEVGRKYYLVVGYSPAKSWARGLAGDPMTIEFVSEEDAQKLIADMRRQ
jgi:hypothetical protein